MNRYLLLLTGLTLLLASCNQDGSGNVQQPMIERLEVSPQTAAVGQSVTYSWRVSVADASCQLDVGADGTPDYTPLCAAGSQSHTFTNPGSFPATLTVIAGEQSVSQAAPVVSVSREGGSGGGGLGGGNGAFTDLRWQPTTLPPFGVAEGQRVSLNGKLYVFGGFDSTYRCCRPTDRTFVFDPVAATWQPLAPLPPMNGTGYGGVTHAGFATDGQDVYFAGGYTSNDKHTAQTFGTSEVWRYNVAGNDYTRLPDLPEARSAGQLAYYNGSLYYFGGSNDRRKADVGTLFILDLKAGATVWREGAPMPNPRNHLGAAVLNGKIYAIAGQHDHDNKLTTQNDVDVYDPKTDTWQQVASLPLAVSHNANSSFVMGGRIIVVGGEVDHLKGVNNIFAYSPETDSWTELTPLPLAMVDPVAENVGGKLVVAYNWKPKAFVGTPLE